MDKKLIDLNGMVHEGVPSSIAEKLIKKGWLHAGETNELKPTPPVEVQEFIKKCEHGQCESIISANADGEVKEIPCSPINEIDTNDDVIMAKKPSKKQIKNKTK